MPNQEPGAEINRRVTVLLNVRAENLSIKYKIHVRSICPTAFPGFSIRRAGRVPRYENFSAVCLQISLQTVNPAARPPDGGLRQADNHSGAKRGRDFGIRIQCAAEASSSFRAFINRPGDRAGPIHLDRMNRIFRRCIEGSPEMIVNK